MAFIEPMHRNKPNITYLLTMIIIVTYIGNLFSIKCDLVHILAKYWSSIAYIKRISTLKTFGHSQN